MEYQSNIRLKYRPYFTDCIQWNEDGQMAICLENQVHIITPLITGMSASKDHYIHTGFKLPPLEKDQSYEIIVDPKEIQTSYLMTEGFRCANWSPIGISQTKGCFLVVVTTKHRVLVYQSSKENPSTGNWELYMDMTDDLKRHAIDHDHPTRINPHHVLYASWSNRLIPDPIATKPAFLALSNKAGDIVLWSYTNQLQYLTTFTPHTSFINLLAWTSWAKLTTDDDMTDDDNQTSCTDGTLALSSVRVQVTVDERETQLSDVQVKTEFVWFADKTSITTLIKIHDRLETGGRDIRIAISKGVVAEFLWLVLEEDGALKVKRDWASYDLTHSAIGLSGGDWLDDGVFRCYTTEGEGVTIKLDEVGDVKDDEASSLVMNHRLETMFGQQWMDDQMDVEEDNVVAAADAMPYIFGASDAPNHIWTACYFAMRPLVDIHYRVESDEHCNLSFMVQKERGTEMEHFLKELDRYVNDRGFFFVRSVRGIVRETLEYLIEDNKVDDLITWIKHLSICLKIEPKLDHACIPRAIYSEPSNIAARILINTELELKDYTPREFDSEFNPLVEEAKMLVQSTFVANILNYVLELSDDEFSQFTEQDITVLLLLSDSSFVSNTETNLVLPLSLKVYERLQTTFPNLNLEQVIQFAKDYSQGDDADVIKQQKREICPVCDKHIQIFSDKLMGVCQAGHFWQLCAITKRVLYTPVVRACVACGSKSLEPTQDKSLTNTILKSCDKCIQCGNAFIVQ
ncbi:MAG: transcription factor IIIC subunit delta N-term-domain-containing protein [Benjaminiella poitrasii]|nr:MAG: transcription factor IIIC subunit delta N-term-domain-containing protein [Benjaminiella poitrasii]